MLSTSWYRKGLFLLDGRWCGSKVQKIKQMHPKPPIDFGILFQYFSGNEKRKRFVFVVGAELRSHQVNMVVLIRQQHRYFQTENK